MKIFLYTFGCKVNQYESQLIWERFLENGFYKTDNFKEADIILINSCTVTAESSKKAFNFIRKVKKENKSTIVCLVGCIPQAFPGYFKNFNEADIVLGNKNKFSILEKVLEYLKNRKRIIEIFPYEKEEKCESLQINKFYGKTRAFIKIQDGCNQFCSYCIIPYARGHKIRSKSLEEIRNQVEYLANNGYKEVVLVGINLCLYGKDLGKEISLCSAVETVNDIDGIERIRLGSLDSQFMSLESIKRLSKTEKLCDQFHLSLQSGSDKILKRMNRGYTTKEYEKCVNYIRENFSNASITTDVMVGFPGETDANFKESLDFLKKIAFYRVHVFPYSERKGTRAENFSEKLSKEVKHFRCKEMILLANKLKEDFLKSQIGKIVSVLFEHKTEKNENKGHAKNYVPVVVNKPSNLEGKIFNIKITGINKDSCSGTIC